MKFEPQVQSSFDLLAKHRRGQLATFLSSLPADWWRVVLERGEDYQSLVNKASEFLVHYKRVCSSKNFSHDWFSSKAWIWHELLAPLADQPINMMELGVFEGRSVIYALELLPLCKVTALDHFVLKKGWTSSQNVTLVEDSEITFRNNVREYGERVSTKVASSWSGLTELIKEGEEFDICYIDASHTAPDVLADSVLAWKLLKIGGLFIWDDFMLDIWDWDKGPVGPGVLAFLKSFPGTYQMIHAGWQVAVQKKAELTQFA